MTRTGWALTGLGVGVLAVAAKKAKKRVRKAIQVYNSEVSSGSKPIEGVGTAIAAFVGLAPGGPVNTP